MHTNSTKRRGKNRGKTQEQINEAIPALTRSDAPAQSEAPKRARSVSEKFPEVRISPRLWLILSLCIIAVAIVFRVYALELKQCIMMRESTASS